MRIGLIGAGALSGEHYYNLIEAVMAGNIDDIVLCDDNDEMRPSDDPAFEKLFDIPTNWKARPVPRRVALLSHIYKSNKGSFPEFYRDYREMLENARLDGVIIGAPNWLHKEMAVAALSRKIPTLCEKPLATTLSDVEAILDAMRENDTLLQIGVALRWRQAYEFIRDKIKAGDIGDLRMIWGREFRGDWKKIPMTRAEDAPNGNWRFSGRHTGGAIMEKLVHDLDLIQWIVGAAPVQTTAYGGNDFFKDGRDTIDNAVFLVEYENNIRLSYEYCMAAPCGGGRVRGRWLGLLGTDGMLDLDDRASQALHFQNQRPQARVIHERLDPPTLPGHHHGNNTVLALDDFLARIRSGDSKGRFDASDAWIVTKLALAIEESIRRGGETIRLEDFDPTSRPDAGNAPVQERVMAKA